MSKRFGRQQKRKLVLAAKRHRDAATAYIHWNRALVLAIKSQLPGDEAERVLTIAGVNLGKITGGGK